EPVGAAFSFARSLDHDATVLVADFGGGTSDFSVMRFSRQGGVLRAEPLGHSGIGIAG
ncbi:MAG TPA: hsp70 family protein, partial [Bradyrhizobium sp.]|nr:hsp70 family protein [Bradyrhizobium sp.]